MGKMKRKSAAGTAGLGTQPDKTTKPKAKVKLSENNLAVGGRCYYYIPEEFPQAILYIFKLIGSLKPNM